MNLRRFVPLAALLFAACVSSGAPAPSAMMVATSGGGAAPIVAAPRFAIAPGAVEPDTSSQRPAVALTLDADGTVRSRVETLGRFDGNRFVRTDGQEVFHVEADGAVAMPWRTSGQTLSLRYVAAGLEVTTPEGVNVLTVDAQGVYAAGPNAGRDRFAPYTDALRDTALMLRMLPMVVLMYGIAYQAPPAGTTGGAATR